MQATAEDRSLPPTPRSPSPTTSPPGSPKRQKAADAAKDSDSLGNAAEDDLETRAAALGLNEVTQRVWKETALPPTPSSPSPTFSPPSSPKQRRAAEVTAAQAAEKLAESLAREAAAREARGDPGSTSCGSDSEGLGSVAEAERLSAIAEWENAGGHRGGQGSPTSRKKRVTPM